MTEVKLDLDGLEASIRVDLIIHDLVEEVVAAERGKAASRVIRRRQAAAVARNALLALAREAEGRKPSLFWDAENLEEGGADVADVVGNYAPGEVVKMQTGYYGPIMWGVQNEAGECAAFASPEEAEAWFATPPSRTQSGEDAA